MQPAPAPRRGTWWRRSTAGTGLLALLATALVGAATAPAAAAPAAWTPKAPPLTTQWTSQVSPTNALPEYPRPQMVRADWLNLNGEWQFGNGHRRAAAAARRAAPGSRSPSSRRCPASSGTSDRMWYRRTFTVPAAWSGRRVQLHFGAVDWEATVYVNGQQVGTHQGGYDGFTYDITPYVNGGTNESSSASMTPPTGRPAVGKQRPTTTRRARSCTRPARASGRRCGSSRRRAPRT